MVYTSVTPFAINTLDLDLDASCKLAYVKDILNDCDVILDITRPHTIKYELSHLLSNDSPYKYWSRIFWNLDLRNQDVRLYTSETGTMYEIKHGDYSRTWWPFWRHLVNQAVNDNELCHILTDTSKTKLLSSFIGAVKTAADQNINDPKDAVTSFQSSLQHVLSGIQYSTPNIVMRFIVQSADVTKRACVRIVYASD